MEVILWTPLGAWVLPPTMIWRNFYDIRTKQVITLTPTTSPDGHRFTKHVVISRTRHHCKASAIPSASATPDLTSLDWQVLIPATIRAQSDDMVVAVYNKLWLLGGGTLGRIVVLCDVCANLASRVPMIYCIKSGLSLAVNVLSGIAFMRIRSCRLLAMVPLIRMQCWLHMGGF